MKHVIITFLLIFFFAPYASCHDFCIARAQYRAAMTVDPGDWKGVIRAAHDLSDDVRKVTGSPSPLFLTANIRPRTIIIGTIGRSRLIDGLIARRLIHVDSIRGRWESYQIQTVGDMLVIAGSDKRGTIYGIYEISRRIGVSPWYWWADAPVCHQSSLSIAQGITIQPSPKVKYRGIFINDEWPSFGTWATRHFGGLNSHMYTHLFELLLRLKANYLWPAMWSTRFNEDDPLNPQLADEYGIVMGTSHHEPMMRAHKEYVIRKNEIGPWDYSTNAAHLDTFFTQGLERNRKYENIITVGMRGDGDVAMGHGDDVENMRTLSQVIQSQRRIISQVYQRPADDIPQLWAIFTEVQRYYDEGFRVPDDVTILTCDNNWGYIRRIGLPDERRRKGGLGLYYHIDMNGGPWNDRWINTSPIPKLREQLHLAYQSGIDRIWIVNVGDLKPKELPIDFIMQYAWNPDSIHPGDERAYVSQWASSIFGQELSAPVTDILCKYPKYNLWRKPETQIPDLFSVENGQETDSILNLWQSLTLQTETLSRHIPAPARDAFYQLVYYPAMASSAVARIYLYATLNHYYAQRHDIRANAYADSAKSLFLRDSLFTLQYNKGIAHGKWDGMMLDNHIGYHQWSIPDKNTLPTLYYIQSGDATSNFDSTAIHISADCPNLEYSIQSNHYDHNTAGKHAQWTVLPDLGRSDACMGSDDVTAPSDTIGRGATLEYHIQADSIGALPVAIGILPTQDVYPARELRLGISIDHGPMRILDARQGLVDSFDEYTPGHLRLSRVLHALPAPSHLALSGYRQPMRNEIFDNLRWLDTTFSISSKGSHTLQLIMIDPEIVLERIIIYPDNRYPSYFGAREKKK